MGSIPAGNDPFIGGSKTPNAPPPALGGSIAPAQTGVSNPIAGVNPGAPFFARNNRGSNIGIPYSRLCPLGGERAMMGLGRPPMPTGEETNPRDGVEPVITETNDLRTTKLAFILGRRSAEVAGVGAGMVDQNGDSVDGFNQDPGALDNAYDYGFQLAINNGYAPGVPGTERFQKLCSFEYLQRYFTNVLCNKGINLGAGINPTGSLWDSGLMRVASAAAAARTEQLSRTNAPGEVGADIAAELQGASMLKMPDLCNLMGMAGSDAARGAAGLPDNNPKVAIRQGIFARDQGPFLRGKGVNTGILNGTPSGTPFAVRGPNGSVKHLDPFHVSRCAGDELAFALFERLIEQKGLTDWRPDGIVLSLGADDPSDTLSDEYFKARDAQLYNVRVQGPAIGASWTGDPALETMPLDKVFVVIVADVWWGDLTDVGEKQGSNAKSNLETFVAKVAPADGKPGMATLAELRNYLKERKAQFEVGKLVSSSSLPAFDANAATAMNGDEATRLCNFRLQLATSSQMINYSGLRFGRDGEQVLGNEKQTRDEFVRVPNQSRMGLRLGTNGGEYIVGGWCIGNVLDTSASRGSMPGTGSSIGARTAPNSMALNINVQIDWWDPDRMWRCFMNKESKPFVTGVDGARTGNRGLPRASFAPRYVKTVPDEEISIINKQQAIVANA
jgi:hypothetical protein